MRFEGFWSQGDGASFVGQMIDERKFIEEQGGSPPMLMRLLETGGGVNIKIYRISWQGAHAYSVAADVAADQFTIKLVDADDPFVEITTRVMNEQLDIEVAALEKTVIEYYRGLMVTFYDELRTEYEYLTSDDSVWEWIESNCSPEDDDILELIDDECDND